MNEHKSRSELTSANLINLAKDNQAQAWQELVEKYGPLICKWCLRTGLNHEDASDVTQDVLIYISKTLENFEVREQAGSFRGWLWKITNNKKNDFLRKSARSTPPALGGTSMNLFFQQRVVDFQTDGNTDINELQKQMLVAVNTVAARVDEDSWRAFEMQMFDSMTTKEVAEAMGKTEVSIRVSKSRIMKSVREVMQELQAQGTDDNLES